MLVLTRKIQEQIVIGENIKVTILRVKGNTVRVGIEAPRQVRVVRSELPPEPEVTLGRFADLEVETAENHFTQPSPATAGKPAPCPTAGPLTAFLVGLALNGT